MHVSQHFFVDLDCALIKTDLLAMQAPFWLLRGKVYLKHRIAELIELDLALLISTGTACLYEAAA